MQGVALLSLEEKIDTSSAAGELISHVFESIAHFERRLISERTKDGILAALAKGKPPGRHSLNMAKVDSAIASDCHTHNVLVGGEQLVADLQGRLEPDR